MGFFIFVYYIVFFFLFTHLHFRDFYFQLYNMYVWYVIIKDLHTHMIYIVLYLSAGWPH